MTGKGIRCGRGKPFNPMWLAIVLMSLAFVAVNSTGAAATSLTVGGAGQQKEADSASAPRITVAELKEKIAKHEKVLILDSRAQGSYDKSDKKIAGAIRVPPNRVQVEEIESYIKDSAAREIVIYCS